MKTIFPVLDKLGERVPFIDQIMRPACVIIERGGMGIDAKVLVKAGMNLAKMDGPGGNATAIPIG